jgi:hypothetical protein
MITSLDGRQTGGYSGGTPICAQLGSKSAFAGSRFRTRLGARLRVLKCTLTTNKRLADSCLPGERRCSH